MATMPPPGPPPPPVPSDMPAPGGAPPMPPDPSMMGAPPPGAGAPPLDPSMLAGLLGPPPSADRSNDLVAGILTSLADHLRGSSGPSAGHEMDESPAFEKKEEGAAKSPSSKSSEKKKSPDAKSGGSKKPSPSKKASSK